MPVEGLDVSKESRLYSNLDVITYLICIKTRRYQLATGRNIKAISPIEKWTCELIVFDTVFGGQWHHLKSYLDTLVLLNLYGGITVADTMKPLEM